MKEAASKTSLVGPALVENLWHCWYLQSLHVLALFGCRCPYWNGNFLVCRRWYSLFYTNTQQFTAIQRDHHPCQKWGYIFHVEKGHRHSCFRPWNDYQACKTETVRYQIRSEWYTGRFDAEGLGGITKRSFASKSKAAEKASSGPKAWNFEHQYCQQQSDVFQVPE